jgi:hypothetical protein
MRDGKTRPCSANARRDGKTRPHSAPSPQSKNADSINPTDVVCVLGATDAFHNGVSVLSAKTKSLL